MFTNFCFYKSESFQSVVLLSKSHINFIITDQCNLYERGWSSDRRNLYCMLFIYKALLQTLAHSLCSLVSCKYSTYCTMSAHRILQHWLFHKFKLSLEELVSNTDLSTDGMSCKKNEDMLFCSLVSCICLFLYTGFS